jgi:4-amino-4-deoxy-L-arabinose transferase-like glycosyltransferase
MPNDRGPLTARCPLFTACCLMLVLFALLTLGARQLSFTFDEPSHLTSGYAFLARGATWTIPLRGHPLFVDAWLALPIYLGDPDIPLETLEGWNQDYLQYVESFVPFLTHEGSLERSQIAARIPAALLTTVLAAVVYRWGADLWGRWIGLIALATLVFDPTLLAHGRLATNDTGVAVLGTLGLYLVGRWTQVPTWRRAAVTGLSLSLAMLAKSSGILWAAVGLGWAIWIGLRRRSKFPHALLQALLMGALSLLIVWGAYGFTLGTMPGWPSIPVPAPLHWEAVLYQADLVAERTAVALGRLKIGSLWWYFPLAFLLKNPLPLLIALVLAAGTLLRTRQCWHGYLLPGLFSVLYTGLAIARGPNIGYRHMLAVHPTLHLLTAGGVGQVWRRLLGAHGWPSQIGRWAIVALGIWYIAGTVWIYPYNLAFFNETVGGAANGWRYLADSNTDWGQGWKALRTFQQERSLTFDYSGPEGYAGTAPYDLWDRPLPPLRYVSDPPPSPWLFPNPGDYVISANTLSGLWLTDPDNFSWFRYHSPDATIAHTLFYYHVDAASAPDWLMQCTVPATPLDEVAVAKGFEGVDLRSAGFDCSQTWIYPSGGQTRGVYALHAEILQPETLRERIHLAPAQPLDSFAARHLKDVPLAYRQSAYRLVPAFALYEWEKASPPAPSLPDVGVGPVDVSATALDELAHDTPPVPLDGPLAFLGAAITPQGDRLDVETWWQVTGGAIDRPFSIMAHLLAGDGTALGIADGLGVLAPTLEPQDVVVQRHSFARPPGNTKAYLRTGAYWLDTGDLWPVAGVPGKNALFVPLEWE